MYGIPSGSVLGTDSPVFLLVLVQDAGRLDIEDRAQVEAFTMDAVKGHFPPEFINRLDQLVVFNRLSVRHAMFAVHHSHCED